MSDVLPINQVVADIDRQIKRLAEKSDTSPEELKGELVYSALPLLRTAVLQIGALLAVHDERIEELAYEVVAMQEDEDSVIQPSLAGTLTDSLNAAKQLAEYVSRGSDQVAKKLADVCLKKCVRAFEDIQAALVSYDDDEEEATPAEPVDAEALLSEPSPIFDTSDVRNGKETPTP